MYLYIYIVIYIYITIYSNNNDDNNNNDICVCVCVSTSMVSLPGAWKNHPLSMGTNSLVPAFQGCSAAPLCYIPGR